MRASAAAVFAGVLAGLLPSRAEPQAAAGSVPLLPLEIPGYELRALDMHKTVRFEVNGSEVEVSVPVFLYAPAGGGSPAGPLLRRAQAALRALAEKREWTADDLQEVIDGLDKAARLLEPPAGANAPHSPSPG